MADANLPTSSPQPIRSHGAPAQTGRTGPQLGGHGSPAGRDRLRRRQDFVAVLQGGRRVRHPLLGLGYRPNGLEHNRYGFAVGKRVGNAVTRNRVRRRLRAILRSLPLRTGHDVVLTAYDSAATATFDQLREAVASCAARAGLLPHASAAPPGWGGPAQRGHRR